MKKTPRALQKINIILTGFGYVGRAFFELLKEKHAVCRERYGLDFQIRAVIRTHKTAVFHDFPNETNLEWKEDKSGFPFFLAHEKPGAVVMCLPSREKDGQPGMTMNLEAFSAGWDVVTADKAPLVADGPRLWETAGRYAKRLKISGAAGAALPGMDTALNSLAGTEITMIEGILNGTSNYILSCIQAGMDYSTALKEAQEKGIAEPDPSLDIEGWDTAKKMLLLANVIFQKNLRLEDIPVQGITELNSHMREKMHSGKGAIKLLGRLRREGAKFQIDVGPRLIPPDHPLAGVNGADKGLSFDTDTMGRITVIGGRSNPRGAAAALLKDLIGLYSNPIF